MGPQERLVKSLGDFSIAGKFVSLEELKRGHIHNTFVSTWEQDGVAVRYVHQQINRSIFRDVEGLMNNIERVTGHIRSKIEASGNVPGDTTLSIIPAGDGRLYLEDQIGECWRTYRYIEDSETFYVCEGLEMAYEAAAVCGRFVDYLADMPVAGLIETIPRFIDSSYRFEQLDAACSGGRADRILQTQVELSFASERRALAGLITTALARKKVPLRVSHNDTKLNNVLFRRSTRQAFCVVDLDTCMPGTPLYDYGDLVRNTAIPAEEDERDLSQVELDIDLFGAITEGFLEHYGKRLCEAEWELLPVVPRLLALTLGVRFLTDYLQGDTYFKIDRPEHNLDRARAQFKIVASMETLEQEMKDCINRNRYEQG